MRPDRAGFALVSCVLALAVAVFAQTPPAQPPQPVFRSTVNLLTLDASVRDGRGEPVPDLQASDFAVTIDGRPRKVVSALYFESASSAGARLAASAPATPRHARNDGAMPGRVIVFVLDGTSIRPGQEHVLLEATSRIFDRLSPADAVGLVQMPGPSIELTRDHGRVADALKRFRGSARQETEALVEGRTVEANDRAHAQFVLSDLTKLLEGLAPIRAPRSVILISGGLSFDAQTRTGYADLQRAAAVSRVALYPVLLEQGEVDISRGETRPDVAINPARAEGLATMASSTGGLFFTGIARGLGVFDRIASEVSSFYQLGLEGRAEDADGKPHAVKVRVTRPGVDVRATPQIASQTTRTAADPLLAALEQPTDVPDVPIAAATYATFGGGDDVRMLVSAEIGAAEAPAPAEWGFTILRDGAAVVTRRARIAAGPPGPRVVTMSIDLPRGDYRLRVAAVDGEDRAGVLEMPFTADVHTVGSTRVGDLVAGLPTAGQLEPRGRIDRSEEMIAMLQLLVPAEAALTGIVQLIPIGTARPVAGMPLTVQRGGAGEPTTVLARGPLAAVPAGRYTVSAIVSIDGQPQDRINRIVEVTGRTPITTADTAAAGVAAAGVAAALEASPPDAAPEDEARTFMSGAGRYVEEYGGQASLIVAVEDYSQKVSRAGVDMSPRRVGAAGRASAMVMDEVRGGERRLLSEFALVPNAAAIGGWLGYRDVIEVDGKRVAYHADRLQALFRSAAPDLEAARLIADESARYNIGPVSRNFNVPTATLFFFHTVNLPRFTFRRAGHERVGDVNADVIEFHESRAPTMIMTAAGKDVPASGRLWIDPADGAIIRTTVELAGFAGSGSRASIEVVYRRDAALQMWVPARMTERYSGGTLETATTTATYRDFKRFETSAKIK